MPTGGDEQLRVTADDVEQRYRDQRSQAGADIGRKAEAGKHVPDIGQKRLVGRRHALGIAGGPGCAEERRDVAAAKSVDDQRVHVRQGTGCGGVHRDPGVLQHELDLGLGRAGVDRDRHAPGRAQAPRGSRGTVPQLPVGQPLAADLDHGLHVRAGLQMAREHRDQRLGQLRVARNPAAVSLNTLTRVGVGRAGNLDNRRRAHSWPPVK